MKILGISAGRPMGNSELLAKFALKGAEDAGCEVEFLRLQDYRIQPCIGCEMCIKTKVIAGGNSVCSIPEAVDDYTGYSERIMEADGIVLAAPCYNLTAAGRMLDALNRQHRFLSQLKQRCREKAKYAATIGVGGSDWTNYLLPILNFAATEQCGSNMHLVDQMLAEYFPAPGSVLLDEDVTQRAYRLGQNIAKAVAEDRGRDAYLGDREEVCPICHGNHLELRHGKLMCPTCAITGHVTEENGVVKVTWDEGFDKCRWSEYGDKLHLDAIRAGHKRVADHKEELRERMAEWRERYPAIKPTEKGKG